MDTPDRPKRTHMPIAVKRTAAINQGHVCLCGCGTRIVFARGGKTPGIQWDHSPALRLRDVRPDGTDYIPAQNDPRYIVGRCKASHSAKTHGTGATTAGTDAGKIKKERKRERERAGEPTKRGQMPSRPMGKGRGFPPRGSRPMRARKR